MQVRTRSRRDAFRNANLVEIEDAKISLSGGLGRVQPSVYIGSESVCSFAPSNLPPNDLFVTHSDQAHVPMSTTSIFFSPMTSSLRKLSCVVLQIRNSLAAALGVRSRRMAVEAAAPPVLNSSYDLPRSICLGLSIDSALNDMVATNQSGPSLLFGAVCSGPEGNVWDGSEGSRMTRSTCHLGRLLGSRAGRCEMTIRAIGGMPPSSQHGPVQGILIYLTRMKQFLAYIQVLLALQFASMALSPTVCLLREPGTLGQRRFVALIRKSATVTSQLTWTSILHSARGNPAMHAAIAPGLENSGSEKACLDSPFTNCLVSSSCKWEC